MRSVLVRQARTKFRGILHPLKAKGQVAPMGSVIKLKTGARQLPERWFNVGVEVICKGEQND